MAKVSVSQSDFEAVACAAMAASVSGSGEQAAKLDRLARKINAALSYTSTPDVLRPAVGGYRARFTWRDVPSVLPSKEQ